MDKIKKWSDIFPIFLILIVSLVTLYPAFSLAYPSPSYEDLYIVVNHFGQNISFLYPGPLYYLHQYGTQFASLALAYRIFEFDSKMYFTLNVLLRIGAALSVYFFVSKWSKSILAGLIAGIFFVVNAAGLQTTTRVSLFQIYVAAIFLCIFLDRWFRFHYQPNKRNLYLSALFFLIAIISHPVRMVGVVPLVFAGEIYFYIKNYKERINLRLNIIHSIYLIIVLLLLVFVTGTLATTPELTFKRLSPTILFMSLMTGFPPVIMSLWAFISNLLIVHEIPGYEILKAGNLKLFIYKELSLYLSLLSIIFSFIFLQKRKFLLVFMSIPVITFSYTVYRSSPHLGWYPDWVIITQIGGTLFLISNLLLFFFKDKHPRLAEIGLFGTLIVVSNLLFPWLISPQVSGNDQSAFTPVHRYYTIPSIGMGLLLSCIFTFCVYSIKKNLSDFLKDLKTRMRVFKTVGLLGYTLVLLVPSVLIILLLSLNALTTHTYLTSQNESLNTGETDRFWNQLRPYIKNIQIDSVNLVYIDNNEGLDKEYIKNLFPKRVAINLRTTLAPPVVNFIFNKEDLLNAVKQNQNYNILAFKVEGQYLSDTRQEILNMISKEF